MKQQEAYLSGALSVEEMVVQQISRDGEFHIQARPKTNLSLLFTVFAYALAHGL